VFLALTWLWSSSASAAAGSRSVLPSPVLPDGFGVNIHFTDPRPGELEMIAAAGIRWVRMDFEWERTERRRGEYDFSDYDRLLAALDAHGIRALFILDYGNPLYDDGLSPHTDQGRRAFAQWAAAAARRFRGRGILWETWNEPNIGFWKPKPNVADYVELALATAKAIREAAPGEALIGPATSEMGTTFLEACFQGGLLEHWDAVSVHPYRQRPPESAASDYIGVSRLIARYAPKGRHIPLLSGEWGYSTAWGGIDEDVQGRMLCRQWLFNVASGVPLSIWYDWHDDGEDPKDPEHHFGMVRFPYLAGRDLVFVPKPSYLAAKALTGFLSGFTFARRLAVGGRQDYVLLFTRGNEVRVAAWTAAGAPGTVVIPAAPGSFRVLSHQGEPGSPIAAGPEGLRVELDGSPKYLAPEAPDPVLRGAPEWQPGLDVDVLPAEESTLAIRVANPSGTPFLGTARLTHLEGLRCAAPAATLSVGGEGEAVVRFAVEGSATGYAVGALVETQAGRLVAEAPPKAFEPLGGFARLPAGWNVLPDGDAKVLFTATLTAGTPAMGHPFPGTAILRLEYAFGDGWKFARIAPTKDMLIAGKPESFGLWIHGDGTGNLARLRFTDATGQTFQPDGFAVNWKGWRYVVFPMDGTEAGHWGGAGDGVVRYPIRWDTLLLIDSANQRATKGTVWIGGPVLIRSR